MKKVKNRALFALFLVGITVICLIYFVILLIVNGGDWASARFNPSIYRRGVLVSGTLTDRNDVILSTVNDEGRRVFANNSDVRRATLHAVGDLEGNIGTGALSFYSADLIGYNFFTGVYRGTNAGRTLPLTIDSKLNVEALKALDGRRGAVMVMNYKTGEVLCMVSAPTFDPADPPSNLESDPYFEGVFLNRAISSVYTPGSVFKLITAAAAIENLWDIYERRFQCDGEWNIGGGTVTCTRAHGRTTFEEAMTVSCNIAFGELALELGADILGTYAQNYSFTERISVGGIMTARGNFDRAPDGSVNLAWSGAGQFRNTVCPATMLRFTGAVANEGVAVDMRLIKRNVLLNLLPPGSERIMPRDTAIQLGNVMDYSLQQSASVIANFPGLDIHAKTGTAEVGGDLTPHAWFAGYITNDDHPLAFVVIVENGGGGFAVASPIANRVLQLAIIS